jgi:hypothetical protein
VSIGQRLFTFTAWEQAECTQRVLRNGTHREAVKRYFGPEFATAVHTGVWIPEHLNPLWVRCECCGRTMNVEYSDSTCDCGAKLPERPAYL